MPNVNGNYIFGKQKVGVTTTNVLSTYFTSTGGGAGAGTIGTAYWHPSNTAETSSTSSIVVTGSIQMLEVVFDGTTLNMYNNGTVSRTITGSYGIPDVPIAEGSSFGNWYWNGGTTYSSQSDFNAYEFIYSTSAMNTTQRQELEGYLAWKWGLQGNLPAGHPYISYSPASPGWNYTGSILGPTGPTGGAASAYTPAVSGNWTGTAPTTIQGALDRIAASLVSLGRYA